MPIYCGTPLPYTQVRHQAGLQLRAQPSPGDADAVGVPPAAAAAARAAGGGGGGAGGGLLGQRRRRHQHRSRWEVAVQGTGSRASWVYGIGPLMAWLL